MAAAVAACAFFLAGCDTLVVKANGAEQSITNLVSRKTDFHPTDVKCPSGVHAKVGGTFRCHFTGPGGHPFTAFMKILKVHGTHVIFNVRPSPDS